MSEPLDYAALGLSLPTDIDVFGKRRMDKTCHGSKNPVPDLFPEVCHFRSTPLMGEIDVFYDFVWRERVPHGKKVFFGCQMLAQFVRKSCRDHHPNKTPILLLTCKTKPVVRFHHTDNHNVLIISFDTYHLHQPTSLEAYYSRHNPFDFGLVQRLVESPEVVQTLLEQNPDILRQLMSKDAEFLKKAVSENAVVLDELMAEKIAWFKEDPIRRANLLASLDEGRTDSEKIREALEKLLAMLATGSMGEHDIIALIKAISGHTQLSAVVTALADRADDLARLPAIDKEECGRMVAAALRVQTRSFALEKLKKLIEKEVVESKFQKLLDQNWWIFGRQYIDRVKRRIFTVGEQTDIMLHTADSYCDLIELKRSVARLFVVDHEKWIVSPEVNAAVNQTAHYISRIEKQRDTILIDFELDLYKLQAFVVIGYINDDEEGEQDKRAALRMYNSHLHRIKVITFDELVRIGEEVIGANEGEITYALALMQQEMQDEPEPVSSLIDEFELDF